MTTEKNPPIAAPIVVSLAAPETGPVTTAARIHRASRHGRARRATFRKLRLASLCACLGLAIAGCGDASRFEFDDSGLQSPEDLFSVQTSAQLPPPPAAPKPPPPSGNIPMPEFDPLDVEGDLHVTGSDTIAPIVEKLYERFIEEGYADLMKIDAVGSGEGFSLYCERGEADMTMASRQAKPEETAACQANGRTLSEFQIGQDAVVVVVHPDNDWLEDASVETLKELFSAEKWSDVNADWPNEPIVRYVPDLGSGTLDVFAERVGIADRTEIVNALNTTSDSGVEFLAQETSANKYALSFFSYAYYQQNGSVLATIAIDGVKASAASVSSGRYPFTRPLYIYVANESLSQKQVEAFFSFMMTNINQTIGETGYFPADAAALDAAKTKFYNILGYDLP
ncbi:MAG: substrate-binding domain-containing protein [Geitlerinemataceae cyanobacterium]